MAKLRLALAVALAVGSASTSFSAHAALVTFTGADDGVSNLGQMTNSVAAAASFDAAVPGATVINFEGPVPAGVSISGGSITNNSGCGALCGFNTTAAGQFFYLQVGNTATFAFTNPIDAFGMFVTGLQTDLVPQETLTFDDGSTQIINTPAAIQIDDNGGGAFIGFTDFGASITSVSYNATGDIISIDDVRFPTASNGSVPEPATLFLLGTGLFGLGLMRWRRAA